MMKARNVIIALLTVIILGCSFTAIKAEPAMAANGFTLESIGRPGQYLTIRNVDPAKAGGTLRTLKVTGRYSTASNRALYQTFQASYLVDETFVIYASPQFTKAYNSFHGTNYTYLFLKECNNGTLKMVPSDGKGMFTYNSQNRRFYWMQDDIGTGVYYINSETGHKLKVNKCSLFFPLSA